MDTSRKSHSKYKKQQFARLNVMVGLYFMVVLLVDLHLISAASLGLDYDGCTIQVNGTLPKPPPLFLLPGGNNTEFQFLLPKDRDGIVSLKVGDKLVLACPGNGNYLLVEGSSVQSALARCCPGGEFCIGNQSYSLTQLNCSSYPSHTARSSGGTCYNGTKKHLEIGFEVLASNIFFKLMDICFDDVALTTLYSKYDLKSSIMGFQRGVGNPRFTSDRTFFRSLILDKYYSRSKQNETLGQILGSEELGNNYTSSNGNFLSRGHLAAKVDFVFANQQRATFHYINVVPQWLSFNNGSWEKLERSVREFASNSGLDLTVYTGTYGVSTLPNANNTPKELYLYLDKNNAHYAIPVPAFFWKVVYNPISRAGIAFVGINNPYIKSISGDHILCQDVCAKTFWKSWDRKNIDTGYAYCCDVKDFRAKVDTLPEFPVVGLLGQNGSRQHALGMHHFYLLFLLSISLHYKV